MKKIIVFGTLIILISCKSNTCKIDYKDIKTEYPHITHLVKNQQGEIIGIADNDNEKRGGAYFYDSIGKLTSYKFFGDGVRYVFNEEFNEDGKVVKREGKVAFLTDIIEISKTDSAFIKVYVSTLKRKFGEFVEAKINRTESRLLALHPDDHYSNVSYFELGMSTKELNDITIEYFFSFSDACSDEKFNYIDSIKLSKNPNLNLK